MLDECVKILHENEIADNFANGGNFPKSAIAVLNTEGTEDGDGYDNPDTIEGMWEIAEGKYTVRAILKDGIPRLRSPVSGAYYPLGEFYFNVNVLEKEVYLSYIFGPRFGRGLKYRIHINEETREIQALGQPQVLWVM